MRAHIGYYIRTEEREKSDDIRFTTFMDNVENIKDSNNCNGRVNQSPIHLPNRGRHQNDIERSFSPRERGVHYDKISRHLKILVAKQENEDDFQDIINEWRLIAHVMDRFLFWVFFIGSIVSSVTILVLKPMGKPVN